MQKHHVQPVWVQFFWGQIDWRPERLPKILEAKKLMPDIRCHQGFCDCGSLILLEILWIKAVVSIDHKLENPNSPPSSELPSIRVGFRHLEQCHAVLISNLIAFEQRQIYKYDSELNDEYRGFWIETVLGLIALTSAINQPFYLSLFSPYLSVFCMTTYHQ